MNFNLTFFEQKWQNPLEQIIETDLRNSKNQTSHESNSYARVLKDNLLFSKSSTYSLIFLLDAESSLEVLQTNKHYDLIFFLLGFSSKTLTIHRTAGEGRGSSFIPLYHFHPLTNIQTFICNFACEMTITYF